MKEESRTPDIDACYEMMRKKFHWDFDGYINTKDLTTRGKVANIICALFMPQEPNDDGTPQPPKFVYTREEFHLIEMAADEIAKCTGY